MNDAATAAPVTLPAPGSQAPILPPGKLELRYLFGAVLTDGSQIFQDTDDKSKIRPDKNAIWDLQEHDADGNCIEHPVDKHLVTRGDVELFALQNAEVRYVVDLRDGHFEAQFLKGKSWVGAHFYAGMPPLGQKLYYFYTLRRRHHKNVTGVVQEDGSIAVVKEVDAGQECEYHFGWTTADRKHRGGIVLV